MLLRGFSGLNLGLTEKGTVKLVEGFTRVGLEVGDQLSELAVD